MGIFTVRAEIIAMTTALSWLLKHVLTLTIAALTQSKDL
jgi:hypothetical protein